MATDESTLHDRTSQVEGRLPGAPVDEVVLTVTSALLRLQQQKGYLEEHDLRTLAVTFDPPKPLNELEEVVSFFPHFRRQKPPLCEVAVCQDMACHRAGAAQLLKDVQQQYPDAAKVCVKGVSCVGRCDRAPAVCVSDLRHAHHGAAETNGSTPDGGGHGHENYYYQKSAAEVKSIVDQTLAGHAPPAETDQAHVPPGIENWEIDPYRGKAEGRKYAAVEQFIAILRVTDDLQKARENFGLIRKLKEADLRGMGGAGQPAWIKWNGVAEARGETKYIVCNADESEPCTFKDRELLLRKPHLIIEGMVLAGLMCGATQGYIYVRHEYHEQIDALNRALAEARHYNVVGAKLGGIGPDFWLSVFTSPGGYICGEQSALIEAMEGHRAQPRNRPPELGTNGLFDKPTIVNNVETLAWVPSIALNGGEPAIASGTASKDQTSSWYAARGRTVSGYPFKGRRFFSICGDLVRPGVYEMAIGAPLRELIDAAGGMRDGRAIAAIAPSGPSGGFLPAKITATDAVREILEEDLRKFFNLNPGLTKPGTPWKILEEQLKSQQQLDVLDLPLESGMFNAVGSMLGAGLAVFAEPFDLVSMALNATDFFRRESCGQCVPCRLGTGWLVNEFGRKVQLHGIGFARQADAREEFDRMDETMDHTSICSLGQVAPRPLKTVRKYFT